MRLFVTCVCIDRVGTVPTECVVFCLRMVCIFRARDWLVKMRCEW